MFNFALSVLTQLSKTQSACSRHRRFRFLNSRSATTLFSGLFCLFLSLRSQAAFEPANKSWEGGSDFYHLAIEELGDARVHVARTLSWNDLTQDDGILLIHPVTALDPDGLSAFMTAGGRLAIVDDFGKAQDTLHAFRIERAPPPEHPTHALRNRAVFPAAEPFDVGRGTPHPLAAGVTVLFLNHPTALRHPDLSTIFRIPTVDGQDADVAVVGQVGSGRLIAMSDPSALTNLMLRYPGNRTFATNLIRYLLDVGNKSRSKGKLYILSNALEEKGSFSRPLGAWRPLDGAAAIVEAAVSDAQHNGLPRSAHLLLAGLGVLLLGRWMIRRTMSPYKPYLPQYSKPLSALAMPGTFGRLAWLAAPTCPPELVLFELRDALARLCMDRWKLDGITSTAKLEQALKNLAAEPDRGVDLETGFQLNDVLEGLKVVHDCEQGLLTKEKLAIPRHRFRGAMKALEHALLTLKSGHIPAPASDASHHTSRVS